MIVIDRTIVSEDVVEKQFVCALDKCKGACCVAGDSGAPLEWEETKMIEDILEKVKPYMTPEGIAAVEKFGPWHVDSEGDFVTPLVDGVKECAFVVMEQGIAKCTIEKAWRDGIIDWQKPVSCHLYPIRITPHNGYDAVNYHRWLICAPACRNGRQLDVPVYVFVKDALMRKYGKEWYSRLEDAAQYLRAHPVTEDQARE